MYNTKCTEKGVLYMRYLKRLTKYNIILLTAIIFALVLPTVITFVLVKKSDRVDKKREEVVFSATKAEIANKNVDVLPELVSDEPLAPEAFSADKKAVPEKDESETNHLTSSDGDDQQDVELTTVTDATANDAEAVQEELVPGEPNGKKVYLTFDDGPSSNTPEILEILRKYDVKATFFVVKNVDNEQYLKDIAEEGHTIGMHSACHIYNKIYKSMSSFKNDVKVVHDWIYNVTGIDSKYYRFPGGSSYGINSFSKDKAINYLYKKGYEYIDWNAENYDAKNPYMSPDSMTSRAMEFIRANEGDSVLLMHDQEGHHNTVDALPGLIETLIREGYEICPVDDNTPTFHQYMTEAELNSKQQIGE